MRAAHLFLLCTALTALFVATAAPASAYAQSEEDARALFEQGNTAAEQGRWVEARELFARSFAITENGATLRNLATARARTGQLIAAREGYQQLRATAASREERAQLDGAIARLEEMIPVLTIAVEDPRGGDDVRVDNQRIENVTREARAPLDPGRHEITLRRGGVVVATMSVDLAEAERERVVLRARVAPAVDSNIPPDLAPDVVAADAREESPNLGAAPRRPLTRSPILWVSVAAVVAAIVITAVVVSGRDDEPLTFQHDGALEPQVVPLP